MSNANPLRKLDGEAVTRALATLLHASYLDEAATAEQRDAWRDTVATARRENDARTRVLPEIAELYEAAEATACKCRAVDCRSRRLSHALAALKEKLR